MRSAGANLLLALGALVVVFLVAETCARAFYHPENLDSVIRFDRHLGWSLKPGSYLHSVDSVRDLDYTIRVNSYGMREREFDRDRKAGRRRILFVGDSFGFGAGVDEGWRLSEFVARALPHDEVLNASVCGWGTDQELIHYERFGRSLDPDVVVLVFCMSNDVLNNMLDHIYLGTTPKPRFVMEADTLVLIGEDIEAPRVAARHRARNLLRNSRFLLFAKRRVDAMRTLAEEARAMDAAGAADGAQDDGAGDAPGYGPKEAEHGHSHWSVFAREYDAGTEEGWVVTEALLARFAVACRGAGADLVVLAFPLEIEVDDAWRGQAMARAHIDPGRLDIDKPFQRLESICARLGVEYLHPVDEFRAAAGNRRLYFERDVHPNEYGHAVAARALLEELHDRHGVEYTIAVRDLPFVEPEHHLRVKEER
jgi:lysophospholipase L1-like esterase